MILSLTKTKTKRHNKISGKTSRKTSRKNQKNIFTKVCNFEEQGNEINDQTTIISISLFKLDNMYRDISAYLNGLENIIKYVKNLNMNENSKLHIFLYYDHSLDLDTKFTKLKQDILDDIANGNSVVRLLKYKCPEFINENDKIHIGMFGAFVRLFTMFNPKYYKNTKIISDSDFTDLESLYFINYLPKIMDKSKHKFVAIQKIGYEWKYKNLFINKYLNGTAFACFMCKNYTLPLKYFESFLIDLLNTQSNTYKTVNKLFTNIIRNIRDQIDITDKNNVKLKTQTISKYDKYGTFAYGIDELFLNLYLIDKVMNDLGKIGVVYVSDLLRLYPLEMIDWKKSNVYNLQRFLKEFLHEDFNENTIRTKFEIISKKIYNKINIDNISNYYEYKQNENNLIQFYKLLSKYNDSKKIIIDQKYLANLELHTRTHNKASISLLYQKDYQKNNHKLLDSILKNTQIYTIYKQR
jgi:hypothetical protein